MNRTSIYMIAQVLCVAAMAACAAASPAGGVKKYTETFAAKNGEQFSFDMLLIDGGEFVMGSANDEPGRQDHEGPRHKVRVDSFYLCPTETTLELFLVYYEETNRAKVVHDKVVSGVKDVDAITGPTPVFGELTMGYPKTHPAMGMTWHNVQVFCKWLSKKTGKAYRLPTEAEWEYAARAGGADTFGAGNDPKRVGDWAWYDDNADGETHPVAAKKPNALGLYDMAGNVCEWVQDFYDAGAYKERGLDNPVLNPTGPAAGKVHVARGGYYNSTPADDLRCAARAFEEKWWRDGDPQIPKSMWWLPNMDIIGFRLARSVDVQATGNAAAGHAFAAGANGEYTFDTGALRGKLRQGGKSRGLSSVVHTASGTRLDGSMGILSPYRIFTANKRYGTAAWNLPSESKLLDDGALQVTWKQAEDRAFELVAVYRFSGDSTVDLEAIVKAGDDLDDFEVFVASYFNRSFPTPSVYVGANAAGDGSQFMRAVKSAGVWQVFPRDEKVVKVIRDGRWLKPPNPVDWVTRPCMSAPIALRRSTKGGLTAILMAPANDCFAISMPYEGEGHYSVYLSLFGRDVKAGKTARARCRFVLADAPSDAEILGLYKRYIKEMTRGDVNSLVLRLESFRVPE